VYSWLLCSWLICSWVLAACQWLVCKAAPAIDQVWVPDTCLGHTCEARYVTLVGPCCHTCGHMMSRLWADDVTHVGECPSTAHCCTVSKLSQQQDLHEVGTARFPAELQGVQVWLLCRARTKTLCAGRAVLGLSDCHACIPECTVYSPVGLQATGAAVGEVWSCLGIADDPTQFLFMLLTSQRPSMCMLVLCLWCQLQLCSEFC
jgi:hypothetical protein